MYNQQGFQSNIANQGFQGSQYRGMQTKYQPIGSVQSQYNQSLNPQYSSGMGQQQFASNQNQYSSFQSPQSFHTANYRGNQQGHDNYLRADSVQPAQQSHFGIGSSSYTASSFGASQQQYGQGQYATQQSFHTANYRGDQPGHDTYQRADSVQPSQSQYGIGASSFGTQQYGTSFQQPSISASQQQYGTSIQQPSISASQQQYGTSIQQPSISASQQQYGQSQNQSQSQSQYTNPQSFHMASYRGNQQGHDIALRADSQQPSQSQFGMGASSYGMSNRAQF
ncbi:hypothetical protein O9H85_02755 [Paenibacillus filicis]|uniref:Uncharacterized protein n=1 Tax=Paenibacillus gyeongsangnamensis TaxID=3388067 RepID=A0ABT4Q3D5_9BACL|nr:hypothetical protein [Paenibacillus filicis]MCZ8511374.1 hypothetical protein [Paenibacillus filicis]